MGYQPASPEDLQRLTELVRPNQEIGTKALLAAAKQRHNWNRDKVFNILREARQRGLARLTIRRGNAKGSLVQMFDQPLPEAERDHPTTFTKTATSAANGVFHVKREVAFEVAAGTYTAQELERLARAVLRELDG